MLIRIRDKRGTVLAVSVVRCRRWLLLGNEFANLDPVHIAPVTKAGRPTWFELVSEGRIVSSGDLKCSGSARVGSTICMETGDCRIVMDGGDRHPALRKAVPA